MKSSRFEALDALRGVAAICVVMFHLREWLPSIPFFRGGYLAVDLFFVLSGFVIEHAYGQRLLGQMSFSEFFRQRVIRLWPMYLVGFTLALGLALKGFLGGETSAATLITWTALSLALLPYFEPGSSGLLFQHNAPAWSLFAEMVANLLYAALRRFATDRALFATVGVAGAALIGIALHWGGLIPGAYWSEWPGLVARVAFSFPAGVLLYRHRERLAALPALPAPALMILTALLLAAPSAPRWPLDLAFVFVASPILVALGARAQGTGRIALWLGLISYPLYAFHVPVRAYAEGLSQARHIPLPWLAAPYVVGCLAAAWVLARFYDIPVRSWLRSLGRGAPAVALREL